MRPIKKGASFQKEIKTRQPHSRTPNRKAAPVAENKVVSLDERAKDEAKPFSEQLLQEGAKKLLQTAIENESSTISNSRRTDAMSMDSSWWYAMDTCRSGKWSVEWVSIRVRQPRVRHRDKGRFSRPYVDT
jgi:hypothetical protein